LANAFLFLSDLQFQLENTMRQLFTFVALIALSCPMLLAEQWPQFRGPTGNGIAANSSAPVSWSEDEGVLWKKDLPGKGWSSPVVADGKMYLTTAIETQATPEEAKELYEKAGTNPKHISQRQILKKVELHLLVIDMASGELVQQQALIPIDQPEPIHSLNSYASPTPFIDGDRIYCHFGTFGTLCLKREDLSVIWRERLPLVHSVGPGSSPFVHGDLLYLICDGVDQQYVTALNKMTGEAVWKTDRPEMEAPTGEQKKAYCTPVVATDENGREQIICMGSQWIVSYHPTSGKELWKVYHGKGFSVVPRPVVGHGMVYMSTGFGKAQLWAIRIDGSGDVTESHVAWTVKRGIPTKPSPILVDEKIFVIDDGGVGSCFDALTGDIIWQERISGNFSASPLLANGNMYLCSHEGNITVFEFGAKYQPLATNELDGQIMASPIALEDCLFIRTETSLYRIGSQSDESKNRVSRK